MQTTFRLNINEIDIVFIEKLKSLFHNKEVSIKIEEIPQPNVHYNMYEESEKLQKKYPPKKISPDIDLSALANEVNL
jgi:hypothetical protein